MGERNIASEVLEIVDDMGDPLMDDFVKRTKLPYDKVALSRH